MSISIWSYDNADNITEKDNKNQVEFEGKIFKFDKDGKIKVVLKEWWVATILATIDRKGSILEKEYIDVNIDFEKYGNTHTGEIEYNGEIYPVIIMTGCAQFLRKLKDTAFMINEGDNFEQGGADGDIFDLSVDALMNQTNKKSEVERARLNREWEYKQKLPDALDSIERMADSLKNIQFRVNWFCKVADMIELPDVLREALSGVSNAVGTENDEIPAVKNLLNAKIENWTQLKQWERVERICNACLSEFDRLFSISYSDCTHSKSEVAEIDYLLGQMGLDFTNSEKSFYGLSEEARKEFIINCKLVAFWNTKILPVFEGDWAAVADNAEGMLEDFNTMLKKSGLE